VTNPMCRGNREAPIRNSLTNRPGSPTHTQPQKNNGCETPGQTLTSEKGPSKPLEFRGLSPCPKPGRNTSCPSQPSQQHISYPGTREELFCRKRCSILGFAVTAKRLPSCGPASSERKHGPKTCGEDWLSKPLLPTTQAAGLRGASSNQQAYNYLT
jgi:hypothetical protein